jgi:hypothetical protein
MEELYQRLKEEKDIQLPIYKVDGVLVQARLYTHSNSWVHDTNGFYFEMDVANGGTYLDSGTNYEQFCNMINGLKDMKFDVFSGTFINPSKLVRAVPIKELPMFHHPNIEMDYRECCVCMELTMTKLPCHHSTCIRCQQKLVQPTCPLCRANTSWNNIS